MLLEKYKPKTLDDIIGHIDAISKIKIWAYKWERNESQRPILLWGKSGTGKTAIAHALSNLKNWPIIELGPDNQRSADDIQNFSRATLESSNLFGSKNLILIEDVDCFFKQDKGGLSQIVKILKNSKQPIILTAQDKWNKKLSSIRPLCSDIELRPVRSTTILKFLKKINTEQKLGFTLEDLKKIADSSAGDVRAAVLDLESGMPGNRDVVKNIYAKMDILFRKGKTFDEFRATFDQKTSEIDMFMLWLEENIPIAYKDEYDIYDAFSMLSKADLFKAYISRREYYTLLRYVLIFITAGIGFSKQAIYRFYPRYSFPRYLRQMSSSKKNRGEDNLLLLKIGKAIHASKNQSKEYLHILKQQANVSNVLFLKSYFRFDEKELAILLNKTPDQIKKLFLKKKKTKKPKIKEKKQVSKSVKKEEKKLTLSDFF